LQKQSLAKVAVGTTLVLQLHHQKIDSKTTIMRSFVLLLCIGLVYAGSDLFDEEKMVKKWAKHKAAEVCFGEDMMKTTLMKMKKALQKCTGMDMPELDLPMFKSPHRMVHALLESAENHQQMQLLQLMKAMNNNQQSNSQQPSLQLVLGQQQAQPQENMFQKMIMKMAMKKLFQSESQGSSPFGNMESAQSKKMESMFGGSGKFNMDLMQLLAQNSRQRRATDDLYDLGDRLTEKLKMEQAKWQGELGNMSCILQECDMIDRNLDITIDNMIQGIERGDWGEFEDEWLKEQMIKNCRNCYDFSESVPYSVLQDCPFGEKWGRIKMYMHCEKMAKWRTCMNYDMKQKLEKSFGKLEDLEQATGLQENQLLPMTMKLLQEQMDMFE